MKTFKTTSDCHIKTCWSHKWWAILKIPYTVFKKLVLFMYGLKWNLEEKVFSCVNDTHWKRLCFTQFSTRMAVLLSLTFFICFHNQLSSMATSSIIAYFYYRCLKNVIHQINSKNDWLLLSGSFTASFELDFVLTLENTFP